jgi:hypothetical protein
MNSKTSNLKQLNPELTILIMVRIKTKLENGATLSLSAYTLVSDVFMLKSNKKNS